MEGGGGGVSYKQGTCECGKFAELTDVHRYDRVRWLCPTCYTKEMRAWSKDISKKYPGAIDVIQEVIRDELEEQPHE
jgi:hypothetical protein